MAGTTNTGIVGYVSNPVATFPSNAITVDIFGNTFYRGYAFGAGDDTGVYWSTDKSYSRETMLFFTIAMGIALRGKFSYGKKLRSSKSFDLSMRLPVTSRGNIDFSFMDECIRELEEERIRELAAYLSASGQRDFVLTKEEQEALHHFDNLKWEKTSIPDVFSVSNTHSILANLVAEDSGDTPYLCASSSNNSVATHISYDENLLEEGNCIFIGGKTFVVSYQEKNFYSNDSHNLALYVNDEDARTKSSQLFLATCLKKSLGNKYTWGNSVSHKKIKQEDITLPITASKTLDQTFIETFIRAIQKLVIKDVVLYADQKIAASKTIVAVSQA